jgi:SWI/SNF-related matrix-associated actin-dependent regulator of chromatin subfamily A member 5
MQKEEDYQTLRVYDSTLQPPAEDERLRKEQLLKTGFLSWSKTDFQNFVQGCEKFGRQSLQEIAEFVQKPVD